MNTIVIVTNERGANEAENLEQDVSDENVETDEGHSSDHTGATTCWHQAGLLSFIIIIIIFIDSGPLNETKYDLLSFDSAGTKRCRPDNSIKTGPPLTS